MTSYPKSRFLSARPYAQFYFPLGSAVHRDTIWVAGHYLQDFSIVAPGRLRLVMRTGARRGCTVELEVSKRLNAAKLSLLAAYAAEVTRRVQPLHQRYHARQMAGGALGSAVVARSYAGLNPAVSWAETPAPEDVMIETIRAHWSEVTGVLSNHASELNLFLLQEDILAVFDQKRYV